MYAYELTFASLHAVKPPVINIIVAGASAVLKPSTARSATSALTGFLDGATLGTCGHIGIGRRDRYL